MARLFFSLIVAPVLVFMGFGMAARYALLAGYPFWILAACIWAFPLAELLSRPLGSFLLPGDRYSRPQPMYSVPEALRKQNRIQESFDAYQKIARSYPREVRPWVEMIRLAHLELKQPDLTEAVFLEGLRELKGVQRKEELTRMHDAIVSMSTKTPTAADRPKVAYPSG